MNRFSPFKYSLILLVLALGILYALPNLYPAQPAIQIAYTDSAEAVSTDFVGTTHVGIIDAQATILTDNQAIVYVWYDNEVGYSTQVLRLATQMAGISYAQIPA